MARKTATVWKLRKMCNIWVTGKIMKKADMVDNVYVRERNIFKKIIKVKKYRSLNRAKVKKRMMI